MTINNNRSSTIVAYLQSVNYPKTIPKPMSLSKDSQVKQDTCTFNLPTNVH
jgi:hypothetical protein